MQSKILIIGGSSILGINLASLYSKDNDVFLLLHKRIIQFPDIKTYVLNNYFDQKLNNLIEEINPNIIINCSAFTNIEDCERNPILAKKINITLARHISEIANRLKIKLVHISTDHVSSGETKFLGESIICNPLNTYAKTKYEAETEILNQNLEAIILRINFFCWGTTYKQSFSDLIINSLRNREKIYLFKDVYFTPVHIQTIYEVLKEMLHNNLSGIYNISSNERISKLEFGMLIANIFKFEKEFIVSSKLSDRKDLTIRPFDMSLSNVKLKKAIRTNITSIDDQIYLLRKTESNKNIGIIRNL